MVEKYHYYKSAFEISQKEKSYEITRLREQASSSKKVVKEFMSLKALLDKQIKELLSLKQEYQAMKQLYQNTEQNNKNLSSENGELSKKIMLLYEITQKIVGQIQASGLDAALQL